MVCTFGVALAVAGGLYPFLRGNRQLAAARMIRGLRWAATFILVASAALLAAVPRAPQPLLDVAEYATPSARRLYLTRAEEATFTDALSYAERYLREADELNAREKRNRTEAIAFDDFTLARISSFLKSYGEMRKGELFVMAEIRSRARERERWLLAAGLLTLALLLAPIPWRKLRPAILNASSSPGA
jgi:zinc/manganese transport system permease protein